VLLRDPPREAPRESEGAAETFNRHMDAAIESCNASAGAANRAVRRSRLAKDLDRNGLVIVSRNTLAGLIADRMQLECLTPGFDEECSNPHCAELDVCLVCGKDEIRGLEATGIWRNEGQSLGAELLASARRGNVGRARHDRASSFAGVEGVTFLTTRQRSRFAPCYTARRRRRSASRRRRQQPSSTPRARALARWSMTDLLKTMLDSKRGMEILADWARANRIVLQSYHAELAAKHGVSLEGVEIARPLPFR
jgi:hypothetical protein